MWFKQNAPALGDFEQLVLFGVRRLADGAYGAAIRQEIHARSGRDVSINAVYTTLDRLQAKGLLRSWTGEPTAARAARGKGAFAIVDWRADRAARRPPPEVLRAAPRRRGGTAPGLPRLRR